MRDGATAIELATQACEIAEYKNAGNLKALAAAFAEDGQFTKAVGWQEKAIELVPNKDKPAQQAILKKYAAEEPLRVADFAPTE